MENNNICTYSILQKHYSALKHLLELEVGGSILDDITKIDAFFSEFRNITFVMQKLFNTETLKKYYEDKCTTMLKSYKEEMKWFLDSRTIVIHKEPFKLEKIAVVDFYSSIGQETIYSDRLTVDNDISFGIMLDNLKPILSEYSDKYTDCFFCITLAYRENGKEYSVYDKIINGISIMHKFILCVIEDHCCDCTKCSTLKEKIHKSYQKIFLRKRSFTWDGTFENGEIIFSSKMGIIAESRNDGTLKFFDEIKSPLSNGIFKYTDVNSEIFFIYMQFNFFHISSYKKDLFLMPTFIIIYSDNYFSIRTCEPEIKTTLYRTVSEIARLVREQNIVAVLYYGEFYTYKTKEYIQNKLFNVSYNERVKMSN